MFYEGRIQKIKKFENLESLLGQISQGFYYELVYCFESNGKLFGLANDQRTCETVMEVAVLNLSDMVQIESVTLDWMDNKDWLDYFTHLFRSHTGFVIPLNFTLRGTDIVSNRPRLAHFECGCCGMGFQSDYKYQLRFDQDAGYGLCPDCE